MTTLIDTRLTVTPYDHKQLSMPDPTFTWRLDPARAGLLVHDMQRYFIRPFVKSAGTLRMQLLQRVAALRDLAHQTGMPVFYTAQPGGMTALDRGLLHELWGSGMSRSAVDRSICPEVTPGPQDVVLNKWRYSAFHRSDLAERLALHKRDQLLVCGVYAHVGIQSTVVDAFSRDIAPFLVADAIADFTLERHQATLDYVTNTCALVSTTAQVLALVGRGRG